MFYVFVQGSITTNLMPSIRVCKCLDALEKIHILKADSSLWHCEIGNNLALILIEIAVIIAANRRLCT